MTNSITVRIGQMPGRINEFALTSETTFADAIALAELNANGYEVKADGNKVTDLNQQVGSTSLILLTKMVKGNAEIRIGQMPGRINEFAVDETATIGEAIALAELNTDGYEVKVDGNKVTDLNQPVGRANLILLTKMVKGNGTVRIGQMPGRINEFALEGTTTFAEAISLAELNTDGYEVKADGNKVTDLNTPIGETNLILLSKMVKGNILGGLGMGIGLKSARVGDQIDAEVKGAKAILSNTKMVAQQFDFVEQQLAQFAQVLAQADPASAMQFQNLQQQINNIQSQIVNGLTQIDASLTSIDSQTNAIQN